MKIQVLVLDSPTKLSVIVLKHVLLVGHLRNLGSVPHRVKQIFFPIQNHSDWLWGLSSLYLPGARTLSPAVKLPSCEADGLCTEVSRLRISEAKSPPTIFPYGMHRNSFTFIYPSILKRSVCVLCATLHSLRMPFYMQEVHFIDTLPSENSVVRMSERKLRVWYII